MRRINPTTSLTIAMTLGICGILAGSAQANDHGRRHGDGDWRNRGERHARARHEHDTYVTYYGRPAEVYYAPPLVVYPPPRPPSGVSIFFPFWFR